MTFLTVERNAVSAAFFDAAANGELLLHRCMDCGAVRIPRRAQCRHCGHEAFVLVVGAGRGTLVTWSRQPAKDPQADPASGLFGLVELEEGPWLESNLIGIEPSRLRPGIALEVAWISGDEGEKYPAFAVVEPGAIA